MCPRSNKPKLGAPVLLTGIAFGHGGVGQLVESLQSCYAAAGVDLRVVNRRRARSMVAMLNASWWSMPKEVVLRLWDTLRFWCRALFFCSVAENVLIIHPQSVGWLLMRSLLGTRRRIHLYLVDNIHFCAKGYNSINGEYRACFRCLARSFNSRSIEMGCTDYWEHVIHDFGRRLLASAIREGAISVLVQNRMQGKLLSHAMAFRAETSLVGLIVPDVASARSEASSGYDFVYHGNCSWVKGLGVVYELAIRMPRRSFLVPVERPAAECVLGAERQWPSNVKFASMSWDDGLKKAVIAAKVVLCPSLWSAPIEGALLKSWAWNGAVVAMEQFAHFIQEVPRDAWIAVNSEDWSASTENLERILSDERSLLAIKEKGQAYVEICISEFVQNFSSIPTTLKLSESENRHGGTII